MKKRGTVFFIFLVLLLSFLLYGCGQDYECDIYRYESDGWNYYSWDVYSGTSDSDAEESCESDWGASYDCRDCVLY